MAISHSFDDLLKNARLLPEESLIAVHFKGGKGGIVIRARCTIAQPNARTTSFFRTPALSVAMTSPAVVEGSKDAGFFFWLTNCDRTEDSLGDRRAEQPISTTLIKPPRCRSDVC